MDDADKGDGNIEEYKQEFLQEVKESLEILNQNFIKLERGDYEAVNEIFRMAHTIKGVAGFMDYKNLENLCHKMENVLGRIRDGEIEASSNIIDLMFKCVDRVNEIVEKIEEFNNDYVDVEDLILELESLNQNSEEEKENDEFDNHNLKVNVVLSDDCAMKSVRALLVLKDLSEIAKVVRTEPDEETIESDNFSGVFSVFLEGDKEKVEKVMKKIPEIKEYNISASGGLERERKLKENQLEKEVELKKQNVKTIKPKKTLESIRVNVEQLDTIMNLVGELVISKSRLLQISQQYNIPELKEAVSIMDKSITSLQDEVMRIRMVKIERVFNKFPRMVRDLSKKLGKKIDFIIEGQDTELDRTILDEMSDPLVHLVRNAVDHGIEMPEERVKVGKSETGLIKLSARREKNTIIIEIEDDGRGLDLEKIKKEAVERGLILPSEVETMSDDDIKMLIFMPGFSTKNETTEISGRGVGMDVVKTTVEKLGGSVRVFTKKGEMTKIRISLPPTVAIIKSLIVRVGNEDYAIPLSSVIEALYVNDENWKVIHGNPFLYVREKLIPAIKLRDVFNVENKKNEKEVGIIVEREGEKYGIVVDAITDQQEIVIKPLGSFLAKIKGFGGVTILGDGRVIPILDVSTLIGGDIFA